MVLFLPGTNTPGRPRTSTINGLAKDAINITLDGINVQDNLGKDTDGYFTYIRPRIDAIEEVTVSTSAGGAESTGEGAVQIKFVTRSGTNEYKGSLYEYHRNPYFNANYWFNNRDLPADPNTGKAPRSKVLLNQFGGRVGGPISIPKLFSGKNKLFFFSNYEEFRLPSRPCAPARSESADPDRSFQYNSAGAFRTVNLLNLATANGQTATLDPTTSALLAQIRAATGTVGTVTNLTDPNLQRYNFIAKGSQTRASSSGESITTSTPRTPLKRPITSRTSRDWSTFSITPIRRFQAFPIRAARVPIGFSGCNRLALHHHPAHGQRTARRFERRNHAVLPRSLRRAVRQPGRLQPGN
jgi:hypothetical protein